MRIFRSVLESQEKKWLQNPLFLETKDAFMVMMEAALERAKGKSLPKDTNYVVVMWVREKEIVISAEMVVHYNRSYIHLGADQTRQILGRKEDPVKLDTEALRNSFSAAMYKGLRKYYEALGGIPVYRKDLGEQTVIVADISKACRRSA